MDIFQANTPLRGGDLIQSDNVGFPSAMFPMGRGSRRNQMVFPSLVACVRTRMG